MPTSLLAAKSSNESIVGFILGTVSDEVTTPEYEFTRTIALKSQPPSKTRNEQRLKLSLHPITAIKSNN